MVFGNHYKGLHNFVLRASVICPIVALLYRNLGRYSLSTPKEIRTEFVKFNEELGLVLGYAVVCKINGEDYIDHQGDHIPEDVMLKAFTDFMMNARLAREMHQKGNVDGTVVFGFPLTTDIAESLGILTEKTGFLYGIKPSPAVLQKIKDGEYKGFSVGGRLMESELVDG